MDVTVDSLGKQRYTMAVRVPAERIRAAADRRLRQMGGRGSPMSALRRAYGAKAWQQALDEVGRETFQEALREKNLKATTAEPEIRWLRRARDSDCEYSVTFEVYPDIQLEPLDSLELEEPEVEVTDADVEHALEVLRQGHRRFVVTERAARRGDKVVFDFKGRIDGAEFDGGEGREVTAVLGEGDILEEVERVLSEHKQGDAYDASIVFPRDYANVSLRGRNASFHIAIHSVHEPRLPPLDEQFAQSLGVTPPSVDALRVEVRARLEQEVERARKRHLRHQAAEHLLAAHHIEVPDSLVEREAEALRHGFGRPDGGSSQTAVEDAVPKDVLLTTAKRKVALGLLLAEVLRVNRQQPDSERVEAKLNELANSFPDPDRVKQQYRQESALMRRVEGLVAEEMAVDAVLQAAHKIRKPMSVASVLQAAES